MKRFTLKSLALAAACLLGSAFGASAQLVDGAKYLLHLNGTDLYLSAETSKAGADAELTLRSLSEEGFSQDFTFTAAEGGYNIAVGENTMSVVRDSWYMRYKPTADVTLTSRDAIFAVEQSGIGIALKNLGTGKYVGADSRVAGSKVYSDKGGDRTCVFVLEALSIDTYKESLSKTIEDAKNLLATTQEGTEVGQYSAEARKFLSDMIDEATKALASDDKDVISAAMNALNAEISDYGKRANIPSFQEGVYKLFNVGLEGTLLSSGWHANSWESANNEHTGLFLNEGENGYNQLFTITKAPATAKFPGYNLLDNEGNRMVNANGKLYVNSDTDKADTQAMFVIEPNGDQIAIRSLATGNYVGPVDNTKGWTWIHAGTNHTGAGNAHLFRAVLMQSVGVEAVASDSASFQVAVNAGTLSVSGVASALVFDMAGMRVAELGENGTVTLSSGLYIVVASAADGLMSRKVVVK